MRVLLFATFLLTLSSFPAQSQTRERLDLHHADALEVILGLQDTTVVDGSVIFKTTSGLIYCDSAVWVKGLTVKLMGNVRVDDAEYQLTADEVDYNLVTQEAFANGPYVELWSKQDSLFAVGTEALYNKSTKYFRMGNRPTMYLNYPDSANMVEVIAENIEYDGMRVRAEATGNVIITSNEVSTSSGCAIMRPDLNILDLYQSPVATKGKSRISGGLISIISLDKQISRIDVLDSARGEFTEPVDSAGLFTDRSILSGSRIIFDFAGGELAHVFSYGQAYSWYNPSSRGKSDSTQNSVSGDTIRFTLENELLDRVDVIGGAVGTFYSAKTTMKDTVSTTIVDTIDYSSRKIQYAVNDSLITLYEDAAIGSGTVALEAFQVEFDTQERIIEAFSAYEIKSRTDSSATFTSELQPNTIPVVLKDKEDVLYGDYLEYSIDTEKGRILKSKSGYETGFFYGEQLYREKRDIFYLDDGRYTTCDADEPHFHFHSKRLKLIENDRLIAKPVVLSIGRLPILAIPYYVFPLKKGRHSGILPFTFGNIERGERYIRNVGYYFAPSEFWDAQAALDYYEQQRSVNFYGKLNYNRRYLFNGSFDGNYTRQTGYNRSTADEFKSARWTLRGSHNHDISPSFRVTSSGQIQSDATYYNDFSTNLSDRLNRVLSSRLNFSKRFSQSVSLSGLFSQELDLDRDSRTTTFPALSLSLPVIRPFGAGNVDEKGILDQAWFNRLTVSYRPSLLNYSSRSVSKRVDVDTALFADTLVTDTLILIDTLSSHNRKQYTRIDHPFTASLPLTIARYFTLSPGFSYTENWFRIYNTAFADSQGIEAGAYRTYLYSTGVGLSTKLYGTVTPNIFGLAGLRQVLTPNVSYSYTPQLNRFPEIRAYAGGGAGSTRRSQAVLLGLDQVYQARVGEGEFARVYQLLSVTTNFGYDFEAGERKYSDLNTSFSSTLLPRINFYGSLTHSLYEQNSNTLNFWSPSLQSFDFNASISLNGTSFIFDDVFSRQPQGVDSASHVGVGGQFGGRKGWDLSATYSFSESGYHTLYRKESFIRFSLQFNLTSQTTVDYSQYYDFGEGQTINNEVSITRTIHCWTGNFYWVPIGSNHGYGFRLFVTAIPAIKIDNSQSNLNSGTFFNNR
ncbi:MAG: putative LPS assembly protein LptD [candidate division Zixibacteria bacterium]|nr:putative LPS assembly protein LptD [candidate division Zixibacteria bacterium]